MRPCPYYVRFYGGMTGRHAIDGNDQCPSGTSSFRDTTNLSPLSEAYRTVMNSTGLDFTIHSASFALTPKRALITAAGTVFTFTGGW